MLRLLEKLHSYLPRCWPRCSVIMHTLLPRPWRAPAPLIRRTLARQLSTRCSALAELRQLQVEATLASVWADYGLGNQNCSPASTGHKLVKSTLQQAAPDTAQRRQRFYACCFPVVCQAVLAGELCCFCDLNAAVCLTLWLLAGRLEASSLQRTCPTLNSMLTSAPSDSLLLALYR